MALDSSPNRLEKKEILTARQLRAMRRHRWTAFGLVALSHMLSFFHRMAPAAISGDLAAAFQTTGAPLGVLAASYFYVYTVMQVPTGVLREGVLPLKSRRGRWGPLAPRARGNVMSPAMNPCRARGTE